MSGPGATEWLEFLFFKRFRLEGFFKVPNERWLCFSHTLESQYAFKCQLLCILKRMGSCELAVLVLVDSAPCRKENEISAFSLTSRVTQVAIVQSSLSVKLGKFLYQ